MDTLADVEPLFFDRFRWEGATGRLYVHCAAGVWEPVRLGPRALEILRVLLKSPGTTVSKDTIMDAVWPGLAVEPNNLTVQIAALRRALDDGRAGESVIQTVPGRGYRLVCAVARSEEEAAPILLADPPSASAADDRGHARPVVRRWRIALAAALAVLVLMTGFAVRDRIGSSAPDVPRRLSIVVLPFENLTGDPKDDYLAAAITDDLTVALAHISGSFVIARATAHAYQGKRTDIREIGRDLGVRYAVRGSVGKSGEALHVNAELGSTETGAQLWSDWFNQSLRDLAEGQEQIVLGMRAALGISLAEIEAARSLRERPANPDAFDLILRGRAIASQPETKETMAQALGLYERALTLDPNSVLALTCAATTVLAVNFLDGMPHDPALDRAERYLARARALAPDAETVLSAHAFVLDWESDGLDWKQTHAQETAVARKLIDRYPNNLSGPFHIAVVARQEGRWDEAADYFTKTIRLSPRDIAIKNLYWNVAWSKIRGGHDQEGLEWADRSLAAPGDLPRVRVRMLLVARIAAFYRSGDVSTAKRLAAEANERYPTLTWRLSAPADPGSETDRALSRSFQDALKAAGLRDHLDPMAEADMPLNPQHLWDDASVDLALTPGSAPGVTTIDTEQLAGMLEHTRPLVVDPLIASWWRSIPGAVGLDFHFITGGSFTDERQRRLERKLRELTGGNLNAPIVALGFNVATFDGYNLALRIRHAGYTNVYWYRGGREAWEVAGMPEAETRPADW